MLTVNGQQFPISDEAYEMVLRAVDADGCDPMLDGLTLTSDGWVAAKIVYVQDGALTGYRVRFKEAAGMVSYEFYDLTGEVASRWTRRVWSMAQLNATPPWPITLIGKKDERQPPAGRRDHANGEAACALCPIRPMNE